MTVHAGHSIPVASNKTMRFYQDADGNSKRDAAMPVSEAEWDVTRAYWEMLAKRYVDIPSKYLSFDLCNEIEPRDPANENLVDFSAAIKGISSVRDAIWKADSKRVLLYSFADGASTESVDAIAGLGIAVGYHCYKPHFIALAFFPHLDF